ncbi:hypothetical protein FWP46_21200 [Vibrio alginolyticus]|nr:hypothetical protein [Vibrio alginolyticus]
MNQNDSSGSLIKPWPVLLDHYTTQQVIVSSPLGKAIKYTLGQRPYLRINMKEIGLLGDLLG